MTYEKTTKCCTYTRVSTSMQVDGYSLEAQKVNCINMQTTRI